MKSGLKHNNRGASLVSVIVAMTVVLVLGVTILYVTYSNFNMKLVDRKSKGNFYISERALEEIVAGLQSEMSVQYEKAYSTVMTRYGTYASTAAIEQDFKTEFILNMAAELRKNPSDSADLAPADCYNVNLIKSYVRTTEYDGSLNVAAKGYAAGTTYTNKIETLSDGLILRDIQVTYTASGYENTICTDIKLSVPDLEFAMISSMPRISEYALIAGSGIVIDGAKTLTVKGNAYAGPDTSNENISLLVKGGTFNAANTDLLVSGGDVKLVGAATLTTGTTTTFWTRGVETDKSATDAVTAANVVTLQGITYAADDMTINGPENNVTLKGEYYGFSYGDTAAANSAIIVNGAQTTIDMSDISTLVVAGTAYVSGTSAYSDDLKNELQNAGITESDEDGNTVTATNKDVPTGDSIAVKSNQIAYLVPKECEGISSNPMSYGQYKALIQDLAWKTKALNSLIEELNRSISSYGDVDIVPIFSAEQGGSVYLFLSFDSVSQASNYFLDLYNANGATGTKLKDYMKNYIAAFSFNVKSNAETDNLTRLITNGNYLLPGTYDSLNKRWVQTEEQAAYTAGSNTIGTITNELRNYMNTYTALSAKLVSTMSSLTPDEKTKTVYENMVMESKIAEIMMSSPSSVTGGAEMSSVSYTGVNQQPGLSGDSTIVTFKSATSDVQAIIVRGDYHLETAGKGIILATGTVLVDANWEGTVISGGKVLEGTSDHTLAKNSEYTGEALRLVGVTDQGEYTVTNFFIGGENYSTIGDGANETKDVRDCVTFENWKAE